MNRDIDRRDFVQGCIAAGALGAGLLTVRPARAEWPKAAFEETDLNKAMIALLGRAEATDSDALTLKAPEIAENGPVVPVTVECSLPGVESLSLFGDQNRYPLLAHLVLTASAVPLLSTRVKLGKTCTVIAVAKAGGKLFGAKQEIKVTIGGEG